MPLSISDMRLGTVVAHAWEVGKDEITRPRDKIRWGLIVKVVGNAKDQVDEVWVKFNPKKDAEEVKPAELDRVYPAQHRSAKDAWRKWGLESHIDGDEFADRPRPVRRPVEDALGIGKRKKSALVAPPEDQEQFEEEEPTVVVDKESKTEE